MTGTERKVFQKYYPPDFDPSKLKKGRPSGGRKNRQFVQRVMTPFNMQCNTCNEYIYKGKKFNMKRETVEGETYLGLKLFRFYFRCPNCLAEITFKTDLANTDYQAEYGATRLFEAFKLYRDQAKAEEAQEEEDKKDPMKMLEKRTMMSRAEMEAMGEIEDLQEVSRNKEGIDTLTYLQMTNPHLTVREINKLQEEEDEKLVKQLCGKTDDGKIYRRLDDSDDEEDYDIKPGPSSVAQTVFDKKPDVKPSFKQPENPLKRGTDQKNLLSKLIVKKKKDSASTEADVKNFNAPTTSQNPASSSTISSQDRNTGLLGLVGYGSGSESD